MLLLLGSFGSVGLIAKKEKRKKKETLSLSLRDELLRAAQRFKLHGSEIIKVNRLFRLSQHVGGSSVSLISSFLIEHDDDLERCTSCSNIVLFDYIEYGNRQQLALLRQ